MSLKKLNVGQVVYILSNKAEAVLPALVVKEHKTTHLDGEEINWTVQYGPPTKQKTIESHKIDGELFGTLDEVREVMNLRFREFVESLVDNASILQNKWYPRSPNSPTSSNHSSSGGDKLDPGAMIQEMEGLDTPPSRMPANVPTNVDRRRRIFDREDLKRELQADDDEVMDTYEEGEKMKLLPDGTIQME